MKQILGDNQFFGVNHYDLDKADISRSKFENDIAIKDFIQEALLIGLDGFMINSNERGYRIVSEVSCSDKEIHYSIPYPHKYATMVNENGIISVLSYFLNNSSLSSLFIDIPRFLLTKNLSNLLPLILDLELPKNLPKGSFVYVQNIISDLVIGFKRSDLLLKFCKDVIKRGYKPGIITLNPILLESLISSFPLSIKQDLVICYNINNSGFNVFPSLKMVEEFTLKKHEFKKMGMSILSSGGAENIEKSLMYIKNFDLDFVVYGSSSMVNISSNYSILKSS